MPEPNSNIRRCHAGGIAFPLFLISAGFLLLLSNFGEIVHLDVKDVWPLLLIAIGIESLTRRKGRTL
jgi:hypothetical protein